jgi:rod shape-determining protein MreD
MEQVRLTIALVVAILLQWSLRNVAEPLTYIDFPLIVVVYAALQRNSIRALLFGTFAGLAVDALSGGLLGANGFSKTLIAYIVSEIARRVYMDNLLLRIPVIAGACLANGLAYYGMHRLLGQEPTNPFVVTLAYTLIGTTIAGTIIFLFLDNLSLDRGRASSAARKREIFTPRRATRRRNPIRLGRRA